ncbi:hypothetical protein H5392_13170 [Tessaracoccus sp. MC1865]|uniref:hypothetical protein n=1 Tax=Tessaracoccus sp. MC1865 TaxID=2760310 RepID=UPI0015FFC63E|nr:hypothetical protein [Tessaracoccus sp. MC1865]MBB1484807.1 hypothetical protein [Tessaracoccus sp. MC1865]QTO38790.1 hypothetical protein J7D54_06880 [Tessaracoccus sp. MC1865]
MSNAQWPPPPGNGNNSPWASQDPSWRPTQFHDAQGRDPRQPFGQQPPAPPSYEDLQPPKRPRSSLFIVLGVVVVTAVIVVGMQFLGAASPESGASPSAAATAEPSPERTGNFIPFEGNGDGIFEIVGYSWNGDQLDLRIRVEVEQGDYAFAIFAFTNETRLSYDPVDMRAFSAREGQPYEGTVTFIMPRADSTIVLTTPSGRVALNALPVKG